MVSRPKKGWKECRKQFLVCNFVRMPVSKVQADAFAKPVQVIVSIICQLTQYKDQKK